MAVTELYRAVVTELERRRLQLCWPMWRVDERSGVQDGYYAKLLWADTPSGRQARWDILQLVAEALFPEGFDVVICSKRGLVLDEPSMRKRVGFAGSKFNEKSVRELMADYGRVGRARQLETQTPKDRSRIARLAAVARWSRRRRDPDESGAK